MVLVVLAGKRTPGQALRAVGLARSTWYYHTGIRMSYAEKYAHFTELRFVE